MSTCVESVEFAESTTDDPVGLVRHLEGSERFHRDTIVGRILHPGTISFRERVAEDSVHILITGTRVSAHVDRYAPLTITKAGTRYSFWRAVAHNLAHLAEDLSRALTGRRGEHRCVLECRRVDTGDPAVDEALSVPEPRGCGAGVA